MGNQGRTELKTSDLTLLILQLNGAIDTGKHQDITIEEVRQHIDEGDILQYLNTRLGNDIDLSLLLDPSYGLQEGREITTALQNLLSAYAGNERRKWRVQNSGLCLMVAWVNELVQQGVGDKRIRLDR